MPLWKRNARAGADVDPERFSMRALSQSNPALAAHFPWDTNPLPPLPPPFYVQLGCGDRVLDGFLNLDFLPHDERVHAWNMLDLWPESWKGVAEGVFSEDVLEHFFHAEQVYILANVNRALRERAVARTLMPSLSRLVDYSAAYSPTSRDVMYTMFGVDTGGDALNMGMRFGGSSLAAHAAERRAPGADVRLRGGADECAQSIGREIRRHQPARRERFVVVRQRLAQDPRGVAHDSRRPTPSTAPDTWRRWPTACTCSDRRSTTRRCVTRCRAQWTPRRSCASTCARRISPRFSSTTRSGSRSTRSAATDPWHFDETQKSRPCMNVATRNQLRAIATRCARHFVVHVLPRRASRRALRDRLRGSVRARLMTA